MDAHLENDLSREILSNSAETKFVLFGATSLFRNGQGVQRRHYQGLSAVKMIAQYLYWSDLRTAQPPQQGGKATDKLALDRSLRRIADFMALSNAL
jgi:hypothetical protein